MKYIWYGFLWMVSLGFFGVIAVAGIALYTVSYYASDLPDYSQLKNYEPPIVTRLYAGDGRLMAEFAQEKRVFMSIDSMPPLVKQAFIAAEDKNFYEHPGVDFIAIFRAAIGNLKNIGTHKRPKGASTITQQIAKNFLLTNEVSYERKIKEAILANRMERAMTKDQLLELYLNEIYLGQRAYGVTAAALQYFDKSLDELSIAEVAYLAALPKAPNNYHPVRKKEEATIRRNWVIDRMLEDGYITQGQADMAKLEKLETIQDKEDSFVNAAYFTEEVRRELAERYGEESLYGGGLAVRSSIDPKMQAVAVKALRDGLMAYDQRHGWRGPVTHLDSLKGWQEALKAVAHPDGILETWKLAAVLDVKSNEASIGFDDGSKAKLPLEGLVWAREYRNHGYAQGPKITSVAEVLKAGDVVMVSPMQEEGSAQETHFKNAYELVQVPEIQGAIIAMDPHTGRILAMQGGWKYGISEFNRATQAQRQPGSAFKPFVYLAALDRGFTPATLVLDAPFAIEDRPGNIWSPTNYSNEYYGPTPIRVGVEKSRNLMTVRLADFLGMDVISAYAARFGVTENMPPMLSNALGAGETTLLKMTTAYAMLVNGGKRVTPTFIDRIQDRYGKTIFKHDDRPCESCGALIRWEDQTAPDVPDTREQIEDPRTAYQIVSILEGVVQRGTGVRIKSLGRPLAGKTGTTNESKDAWFIGFSPDLAVGVFTGFDEPRSLGKRETGSSVAVPIFKDFMEEALKDAPLKPFRMPRGIRNVQINADTGVRAQPGDEHVIWESFLIGTEPGDDMYILDGRGISLMPTVPGQPAGSSAVSAGADVGTGGLY
ncbi:MAG: penicillin-binding protein 1A [Alphaproteobacteria bacterium]|nr:penicillin-binding protein 1A [Alphaproteobacteria bacterium]